MLLSYFAHTVPKENFFRMPVKEGKMATFTVQESEKALMCDTTVATQLLHATVVSHATVCNDISSVGGNRGPHPTKTITAHRISFGVLQISAYFGLAYLSSASFCTESGLVSLSALLPIDTQYLWRLAMAYKRWFMLYKFLFYPVIGYIRSVPAPIICGTR